MFLNSLHLRILEEKTSLNRQSDNLKSAYPVLVGTNLLHLESFWTFTFCYLTRHLEKQQILLRHRSKNTLLKLMHSLLESAHYLIFNFVRIC